MDKQLEVAGVDKPVSELCKADDNTDKPTIKERMDCATRCMRIPEQTCHEFYYWTGYFTALVEISNGDMQDYERL
jgi:hypothetical protein